MLPLKNAASTWKHAVALICEKRRIIEYKGKYCMSCKNENNLKRTDCEKYVKNFEDNVTSEITCFNELIENLKKIRFLKLDAKEWLLSECTCVYWHKKQICKHVMIVSVNSLGVKIPALDVPIESNPSRGRKKGTTSCLTQAEYIQFNENLFPYKEYNSNILEKPSYVSPIDEVVKSKRGRKKKIEMVAANISPEKLSDEENPPKRSRLIKINKKKT